MCFQACRSTILDIFDCLVKKSLAMSLMEVGRLHMMPIPDPASACVVGDGGDVWDCEGFECAKGCEAVIVRGCGGLKRRRGEGSERWKES